jgi:PHD/YefM family antitoxin component YafN of YafNO toxin-antitoxin module
VEVATHSIRPLNDLTANPKKVLSHLQRSKKPVLLTKNGKPRVMLINIHGFSAKNNVSELERLIEEAEADVAAGRIEDCDQYVKRLCEQYNVF